MERCRLTDKYGQIRTITDDNGQQIAHCLYAGECRMVCFAARPTSLTSPTRPTQRAKSATDDNGQQIANCLWAGECRMVCIAARPTRPTSGLAHGQCATWSDVV